MVAAIRNPTRASNKTHLPLYRFRDATGIIGTRCDGVDIEAVQKMTQVVDADTVSINNRCSRCWGTARTRSKAGV